MIKFSHVSKTFEDTGQKALRDVSFQMKRGSFHYIIGESGAGKSTVIKMLLGEEKPDTGCIELNGVNVCKLQHKSMAGYRRNIGVIFQDYRLIREENVFDNVALPLRVCGASKMDVQKKVSYMLGVIGMSRKFKRYPDELSGGEQQKICLARAIINNPCVLLADEPTANLDPYYAKEVASLLEMIHQRGTTVLMVTHNRAIMNQNHEVITLNKGKIV